MNELHIAETNIFDKEELYYPCTVQVLTNTQTGEVSIGWWKGQPYQNEAEQER